MNARRALDWHLPLSLGVAFAGLLGAGFVLGLTGRFGERLGPPPVSAAAPVRKADGYTVVALGDSITHGTGDAADRGGYAGRVAAELRERDPKVRLLNLAIPGDETADLLRQLASAEIAGKVASADLILLSIGGNDLAHALRGLGGGDSDPAAALVRAKENLGTIVARLRQANPSAPIRLLGLYNPFEILASAEAAARAELLEWNIALERAALPARGVLTVPIADLFAERRDRLAGDHFHPGPRGHEAITARVLSTLPEAER